MGMKMVVFETGCYSLDVIFPPAVHMLENWSVVWKYQEVLGLLRGGDWRKVFRSLKASLSKRINAGLVEPLDSQESKLF